MVKIVNRKLKHVEVKKYGKKGWDEAIQEANRQIIVLRLRMSGLKQLIKQFTDMKKAGEPWPGDSKFKDIGRVS
jgi:hypothetical protein